MRVQAAQAHYRAALGRAQQARLSLRYAVLTLALALATGPAAAEVVATPDGFTITHTRSVQASPAAAWTALTAWGSWWSDGHSWSGKAANISLDSVAEGCLCERWAAGEVAHGRVLMVMPGKRLLIDAPLGPLQALPVVARLAFTLKPAGRGTTVTIEMRVAGTAANGLGGPVDGVLREAADRLARRIDTGRP
ncbi:SRPBCC family protein [Glacieibacterium frigidum]|nr:SRPBCC family protein [Glacieibacterium frigidum]